jgi:ABC-2 type transport system permease protein
MCAKVSAKIIRPFIHCWVIFKAETKRLVTYRGQFWFELILSSLVDLSVTLILWQAFFASTEKSTINGYGLLEMTIYMTVATFFNLAIRGTGIGTFQSEVYQGTLTKFLIYPLSVFSYKLGTFLPRTFFAVLQMFVALSAVSLIYGWSDQFQMSITGICLGLLTLLLASIMYFFLLVSIEAVAFWADNVWALSYVLQIIIVFFSGRVLPLEFFPDWFRTILSFSPFPFFAYLPTQIFLGQIDGMQAVSYIVIELFWLLFFYALCHSVVKRGLYSYTGVGQ